MQRKTNLSRHLSWLTIIALPLVISCASESSEPGNANTGSSGNGNGTSSCQCDVSYDDQSETLSCGEGSCFGSDDRWAFCTPAGEVRWGKRTCIQDAWDDTKDAEFECDSSIKCKAGTYCAVKVGPAPRRSECLPLPASCTPPTDAAEYANCLFEDAKKATVCSGSPGLRTHSVYLPRAAEITCD